jgi:hypothetical protein
MKNMKKIIARFILALLVCGSLFLIIDNLVIKFMRELTYHHGLVGLLAGSFTLMMVGVLLYLGIRLIGWAIDNAE